LQTEPLADGVELAAQVVVVQVALQIAEHQELVQLLELPIPVVVEVAVAV